MSIVVRSMCDLFFQNNVPKGVRTKIDTAPALDLPRRRLSCRDLRSFRGAPARTYGNGCFSFSKEVEITKKITPGQTDAPQKGLRLCIRVFDEAKPILPGKFWFGHYFESYFGKEATNG